jgi:hypothetical protein
MLINTLTYSVAAHQKQGNFLSAQNIPSSYRQPLHLLNFPPLPNEANEWETVSTKKRPRSSPDKRTSKQTRTDNYWLNPPTTTSNRFEMLESEEDENTTMNEVGKTTKEKVFKPPSIFVQEVKNISPLTDLLNAKAKDNYEIKVLNLDQVKIQPLTSVFYTVIALEEKKTKFHTYKQKNQRAFRTVLKTCITPLILMT